MKEQLIETWSKDRKCSSRGHAYKILKHNIGFEKYPDILTSKTMKNHHKISYIKPSSPFKAMQADGIVHLKMRDYVYCVAMTQRRWDSLVFFKTFSLRRNEKKIFRHILTRNIVKDQMFRSSLNSIMSNYKSKYLRKLFVLVFISSIFDAVCSPLLFSCCGPLYQSLALLFNLTFLYKIFYVHYEFKLNFHTIA